MVITSSLCELMKGKMLQTIVSEFESHSVPYTAGLVPHRLFPSYTLFIS